jgi:hypothetical protein
MVLCRIFDGFFRQLFSFSLRLQNLAQQDKMVVVVAAAAAIMMTTKKKSISQHHY